MNNQQREVLSVHRNFLLKNVIWTSELANKLTEEGLVTESVIRGIQNAKTQEEKVSKILEFVIMRGPEGYRKFSDILHATGHTFLADFLREEDIIQKKLNTEEMYKAMPFLNRLKENEKNELDKYFIDKFRNESLRQVWKHDFREKEKAILARQQQIEMSDEIKGQTKKWQVLKKELEDKIKSKDEEIMVLNLQIKSLNQAVRETEQRLRADFQKQMHFNEANENQIKRVQENVGAAEMILGEINEKMAPYLKKKARILTDKERKVLEHYKYSFMIPDFEVFLEQYLELLNIRKLYEALREDKEYVLTYIIGYSPKDLDEKSLKEEFKQYLIKTDESITDLKDKLSEAEMIIEGQKEQVEKIGKDSVEKKKFQMGAGVWQGAIMNVMRNQLQDLKRDIRLKESRIQMCEKDAARLKNINNDLKQDLQRVKMEKQSVTSRETRHTLSIDVNGRLSINSDNSAGLETALDNYSDCKTEVSKGKQSLLPPMNTKVIRDAVSPTTPRNLPKPKPFVTATSEAASGRHPMMSNGLVTAPVRLEKRHLDRYSQMPHGFGDVKKMHSQGKSKFEKALPPPKIRY
ncbi:unnamed protein product [Mytilus coruscus]|uniref:CARD domain-containing protein n=1 Tax=Mytilus coruscus TaxID=42192 RepID=A0A6J8EKT9_MYTCO|nr:unnamed protein product [Mytilus coruscus]